MNRVPARVLWSWERREDLRQIDTGRYAIAYLDRTITIGLNAHPEARRNPVLLPEHATLMPVVRIETMPHAVLDAANREATVRAILDSARKPGIAALEIDFDATASQREFYRGILEDVRKRMPAGLPLSMTALASWCSFDDWLRGPPGGRSGTDDVPHGARPPPRAAQCGRIRHSRTAMRRRGRSLHKRAVASVDARQAGICICR